MKRYIAPILLTILLSSVLLFGQQTHRKSEPVKVTFYYNLNWELTTQERSSLRREAFFDLQEMVFDGVYQDFNKENKLIAEGYYAEGRKRGIQTEHFDDQSIKSTIEYSDDDFIIWQLMSDSRKYEVIKGTGKFLIHYFYFFDYYLKQGTLSGEFQNGKRVGKWVYEDLKKVRTDVEYYRSGKLWERVHYNKSDSVLLNSKMDIILSVNTINAEALAFDKESFTSINEYFETQIDYPPFFRRDVSYPGGIKHLLRLLIEADVPEHYLALIKVKINEHGQVLKTTTVRSVDTNTDDRVLKAFELHQSRLVPPMKDGKPYATIFYLPISGGERWEKMLQEMPTEYFLDANNFY